ncbi:hypothetical protein M9H77_11457 [Catharanthus roseus]|uniref:Uncharacterized protein n=1 Tax=Catharanthus roseus TaxID=4058 RepID=A0ACC0BEU1_CATRO|nr:hypothetical protein M9H77_11457 [Catharanthus roseus]
MALTGWTFTDAKSDVGLAFTGGGINGQELFDVATDPGADYPRVTGLHSGNIVPSKLLPLVKDVRSSGGLLVVLRRLPICTGTWIRPHALKLRSWLDAWIYMYFSMFVPSVRPGTQSCKPYIHQLPMLGDKIEHKLLDIRLRLDMMSADEATNNKIYVVRKLFVEALWLEAPSHLLTKTWTNVPAIPPSACTNDYMEWFLCCTHPRIQNPINVPRRFHVPVDPPMPVSALMDMIAREVHRDDAEKEEKYDKIANSVNRHYRSGQ